MRVPWPGVAAGVLVLALGAAGLVRAAVPESSAAPAHSTPGQLAVTGAYVREPVPPTQVAAGYFTVRNGTNRPDVLEGVSTGAGLSAQLHVMDRSGAMHAMTGGVTVPAHGDFVLTTGQSHLMISQLVAPLHVGDHVNIDLDFRTAGTVDVVAPVIAVGAPAPTASAPAASAPMPAMSGAHS
ncbi:copper chaperone PCu(A)C [uncultured Jatrophihabitans sp.]|uniref:copper chaperone PCu(A)C n=1 Tax=uncultured Jatrophihabitans sp. TaxID=1610747 RepID=UPI0035CCA3AE